MSLSLRVLIVEDSVLDAEHTVVWLRSAGYDCGWTRVDRPEALTQSLESAAWDLVICDYRMPAFSGLDALRIVRERDPDIPFILLSGGMDEETALEALRAGATDIAFKDRIRRLGPIVERALQRREERAQAQRVLERRVKEQEGMAEMGALGLSAAGVDDLVQGAVRITRRVLDADLVEVLEYDEGTARHPGIEQRLEAASMASGAEVTIGAGDAAYGVLGVYYRSRAEAPPDEVRFLGSLANTLATAIARRRADEALAASREEYRALSSRLRSLREDERARIARDVHDQLGQALTAIKLEVTRIDTIAHRPPSDDATAQLRSGADTLVSLTDATLTTVRRIASELRPALLDHLGLEAAIEWQLREFERRTGIAAELTGHLDRPLDAEQTTACFRIVQEGLTNVARHAHASQVAVTIACAPDVVTLELVDDGQGMQMGAEPRLSLGLVGMRERAAAVGGAFAVLAAEPRGTRLRVSLPVAPTASPSSSEDTDDTLCDEN